jgi:hypothetical protein
MPPAVTMVSGSIEPRAPRAICDPPNATVLTVNVATLPVARPEPLPSTMPAVLSALKSAVVSVVTPFSVANNLTVLGGVSAIGTGCAGS